jgi:hypothetical protein
VANLSIEDINKPNNIVSAEGSLYIYSESALGIITSYSSTPSTPSRVLPNNSNIANSIIDNASTYNKYNKLLYYYRYKYIKRLGKF